MIDQVRWNGFAWFGEVLFLKEPYRVETGNVIKYKFSSLQPDKEKWRNKLFMKEDFARYYIKITGKRRERLQDISDEDCIREGIYVGKVGSEETHFMTAYYSPHDHQPCITPKRAFSGLIDEIYGPCTWDSNPMVTRYEFVLVDF